MKNILALFTLSLLGCGTSEPQPTQKELVTHALPLLESNGLTFKDHNRNGVLDPYEDWRLGATQRAEDLVGQMNLAQKAGFMMISTTRLENDWSFERRRSEKPITSNFNEEDLIMVNNVFTKVPLAHPMLSSAGTTKGVAELNERHFILRVNTSADILATWQNNLQDLCEKQALAIPALVASNPRNHVVSSAAQGLSLGAGKFTAWPGELGLAAARDEAMVYQFADYSRQEWLSIGLRKGYMYMADLATEPRWMRIEGTFGESAELAASVMKQIVLGFQGPKLNPSSIALTTKHFPGGGAVENGHDPHFEWGKRELFEGGKFENNLIPFKAAIDAGTSAIMPYYSYPVFTEFEEVAYAYNKKILQEVLRQQLGFQGIINSDTGPIHMMPWGVEQLSLVERYKLALEAGINIFSGTADPAILIETLQTYPELMPLVDDSVIRLLIEKFELGLFENPFVSVENALATVGKVEFQKAAQLAHRKAIVLLRNEDHDNEKILPLKKGTKIYFYSNQKNFEVTSLALPEGYEQVTKPEAADVVVSWIIPKAKSLFDSDGTPISLQLSDNAIAVEELQQLQKIKPMVVVINYTSPWVIDEIYNENSSGIKAVLATFGATSDALFDVLTGGFAPTAKMPFSTPKSSEAVLQQKADVPGYEEDFDYALFHFDEGMTY